MRIRSRLRPVLCAALFAASAGAAADAPLSPFEMCSRLEARLAAGDGVTLPDADRELIRFAGAADLSEGDWPDSFLAYAGETVFVAVSPVTGCYEFFDKTGFVFWTVVPVLPTTDNWIAPFRRAGDGPSPDDALYASWRLVDAWLLSHAESAEFGGREESAARPPDADGSRSRPRRFDLEFVDNCGQLRFVNNSDSTNLCITAFACSETNLFFTAAWPTNEPLPGATLDLYGATNLLSPSWTFLSSHPATNPPAPFAIERASLPWHVAPTQHVHGATCESVTNVVVSPLDGATVYTNVFWSCSTNRTPGEAGFFRLGTRHDTDGDGLSDAFELLSLGTDPASPDTDGDGIPDGVNAADWLANPLWATNAASANLVIALYEPLATNAHPVLVLGGLVIPLVTRAGPFYFTLPPGELVPCRLIAGSDFPTMLWCGPPEGLGTGGSPYWGSPGDLPVATPLWCDDPDAVFGGNLGGGSCNFAVPVLAVSPDFDAAACPDGAGWCVHVPDDVVRFSPTQLPAAFAQALQPSSAGNVSIGLDGKPSIDLTGTAGAVRSGSFGYPAGWHSPASVLWGDLWRSLAVHRCTASAANGWSCTVCGCTHLQEYVFAAESDGNAVRCGSANRIHLTATLASDWAVSPAESGGMRLYATATGGTPSASIAGATDVWVSAADLPDDYVVTATSPAYGSISESMTVWSLGVSQHPVTGERDALGHVVNPAGSVAGWTETFRIGILPEDYLPGSGAHWVSLNGATVVSGASSTEARVTFGTTGLDILLFDMPGYVGDPPEAFCTVFPSVSRVPLHRFYILDEQGHRPQNLPDDNNALDEINKIWRQAGMEFYWGSSTDIPGRTEFLEIDDQTEGLESLCTNYPVSSGLRVFFVDSIRVDAGCAEAFTIATGNGVSHGVFLQSECDEQTFSHELGHTCGLEDMYVTIPRTASAPDALFNLMLSPDDVPSDGTGFTFYADNIPKGACVTSCLMYGFGPSDYALDIPRGKIFAANRNGMTNLLCTGLSDLERNPQSFQGD